VDAVKFLLENNAQVNIQNDREQTPLDVLLNKMATHGQLKHIPLLVRITSNMPVPTSNERKDLCCRITRLLLKAGAVPHTEQIIWDPQLTGIENPLIKGIITNNINEFEQSLTADNFRKTDRDGWRAIDWAIARGNERCTKMLIKYNYHENHKGIRSLLTELNKDALKTARHNAIHAENRYKQLFSFLTNTYQRECLLCGTTHPEKQLQALHSLSIYLTYIILGNTYDTTTEHNPQLPSTSSSNTIDYN
jgi:ankyrin repeat protein